MIKLLCVSDSHGAVDKLSRVIKMHADADYLIHAGDGAGDLDYISGIPQTVIRVSGNCDMFDSTYYPMTDQRCVENVKLCVRHGHRLDVKYGLSRAEYYMEENEIDLLIFGHTHDPLERCVRVGERLLYLFNPGSVRAGDYGLVTISDDKVLMSHGTV